MSPQDRFSWIEQKDGLELRRFEEEAQLDLPRGRAFAGYGAALAAGQIPLEAGAETEIIFVAFTPRPRAVTLQVHRDKEERIAVAGRPIRCDRYTLHPKIPFPVNVFAGAKDAHLWLTHAPPPALLRAEQNLEAKDDPVVVIDVVPRGPARHESPGIRISRRRDRSKADDLVPPSGNEHLARLALNVRRSDGASMKSGA